MYKKILILTCFTVISLSTASSSWIRETNNLINERKIQIGSVIIDTKKPMEERKDAMKWYILNHCRCFSGSSAIHIDLSSLKKNDALMLYCLEFGDFDIKFHEDEASLNLIRTLGRGRDS